MSLGWFRFILAPWLSFIQNFQLPRDFAFFSEWKLMQRCPLLALHGTPWSADLRYCHTTGCFFVKQCSCLDFNFFKSSLRSEREMSLTTPEILHRQKQNAFSIGLANSCQIEVSAHGDSNAFPNVPIKCEIKNIFPIRAPWVTCFIFAIPSQYN